jgi:hypothetical protein
MGGKQGETAPRRPVIPCPRAYVLRDEDGDMTAREARRRRERMWAILVVACLNALLWAGFALLLR